jgi:hypothetical protein
MKSLFRSISHYHPHQKDRSTIMLPIIITLLSLLSLGTGQDFTISASNTAINQMANYTIATGFFGVQGYDILSNSIFMISFPSDYNTTLLHNKTYSGGAGTDACFGPCSNVIVTFTGNSFALSGLFTYDIASSDSSWTFKYTIFNVLNPATFNPAFSVTIFSGSSI